MSSTKDNKTGVYIFRLPGSQDGEFTDRFKATPIVGVTSKNMFARKIVMDYLLGRLVYMSSAHAKDNPLLQKATTPDDNGHSRAQSKTARQTERS